MTPDLLRPLTSLSAAFGRLDQALHQAAITPAVLFRQRLQALARHSAVDGHRSDPWWLMAELHGLRLNVAGESIFERGTAIDAAAHALTLWRWHVHPDPMQQ